MEQVGGVLWRQVKHRILNGGKLLSRSIESTFADVVDNFTDDFYGLDMAGQCATKCRREDVL